MSLKYLSSNEDFPPGNYSKLLAQSSLKQSLKH